MLEAGILDPLTVFECCFHPIGFANYGIILFYPMCIIENCRMTKKTNVKLNKLFFKTHSQFFSLIQLSLMKNMLKGSDAG